MIDSNNDTPSGSGSLQRNTAPSLRLPKATLKKVRQIVDGSVQLLGPASAAVIADQIGRTAKGQGWTDQWSTVRFLGFIEKTEGSKYNVTERGRRFLSEDDEESRQAAQEGLMLTGFGPLIRRFGTGTPNLKAISNVLISDYSVPEAAAGKAALLLVEMATECRLVVDGRFKPADIERAEDASGAAVAPSPASASSPSSNPPKSVKPKSVVTPPKPAAPTPPARATAPIHLSGSASEGGGAVPVPFGLGPTVVLNVDATKLTALEIAEIVRELQRRAISS